MRELILVPARNSEAILTREGDQHEHGHEEEFLSSNIFISDKRFFPRPGLEYLYRVRQAGNLYSSRDAALLLDSLHSLDCVKIL